MKKVIIVIAVVGRPIPMIPFTKPATKKAKTTIRVISLALDEISKIKLSRRFEKYNISRKQNPYYIFDFN
tara:strand:- start:51 stop:260 length:210 start_codon:yes stop_codon:yes gene_type:complete